MLNLDKYSPENLERIKTIIKVILDEFELQEINHFVGNKIPLKNFEKENFFYAEVITILNKVAKEENNIFKIANEEIERKVNDKFRYMFLLDKEDEKYAKKQYRKELLNYLRITEEDLINNIILRLSDDTAINRLKTLLASIKNSELKQTNSTFNRFCKFENNTFSITLKDETEKSIPFDTERKTNKIRFVFEVLFEHWKNHGSKPIAQDDIRERLKEKLSNEEIRIKDSISFIRRKIKSRELSDYMKIIYNKPSDGYILDIKVPF